MGSDAGDRWDERLKRLEVVLAAVAEQMRMLRVPLPPRLLSVSEVADVLQLSSRSVQRLITAGEIRGVIFRCGRRTIFRVQLTDLQDFIDREKSRPRQPNAGSREPPTVRVPVYD